MSSAKKPKIKYAEIWGLREEKYEWLEDHEVKNTDWQKLSPADPYYFFVPTEKKGAEEYQKFIGIQEIFPVSSTGIVTARDNFVINSNKQTLKSQIEVFLDPRNTDDYVKTFLAKILGRKNVSDVENYAWRVSEARDQLREEEGWQQYFTKILYRPFDERWIFYHPSVVWRTREEVMQHLLRPNLALVTCRQQADVGFWHALVADKVVESCYVSNKTREIGYTFPLYLYTKTQTEEKKKNPGVAAMMLFDKPRNGGYQVKRPNISPELLAKLKNAFGKEPSPEEIFYYIYAVLYSNTYRQKYQEFLKIDFPRVPFTKDGKVFRKLAGLGRELVDLHLLKSKGLEKPIAKFQGRNDNLVEKREYKNGRVYINEKQYFEGIRPEVWEYQIGGYQVLDKWLKDRKGRALSAEDIKHYCKVVTALWQTVKLQKRIDEIYPDVEIG